MYAESYALSPSELTRFLNLTSTMHPHRDYGFIRPGSMSVLPRAKQCQVSATIVLLCTRQNLLLINIVPVHLSQARMRQLADQSLSSPVEMCHPTGESAQQIHEKLVGTPLPPAGATPGSHCGEEGPPLAKDCSVHEETLESFRPVTRRMRWRCGVRVESL